ncbi:MAG: biotin synthase BioB [Lachnospiraceae bacterium]|nr:biotin synthase BioB [Lachnospiraceae bacterium]
MYEEIVEEIINGRRLHRNEDLSFLLTGSLEELKEGANRIREALCGNRADLCTIINGRAGKCSENCKFCAQSAHHSTGAEEYGFLDADRIVDACRENREKGVHRFSIVTAGRALGEGDYEKALETYKRMHEACPDMQLCASHGLLTEEQFRGLVESGVSTYHANIETSENFFPKICTTHTFQDKLACIQAAKKAGLQVCSGGIIGLGESMEDRVDMAFTLSELGIASIPLNVLLPIAGTPLENQPTLPEEEILRTIAIFRFINPTAYIRLAAGRAAMGDGGREAFLSGANATITGDMLTTSGNNTAQDREMLSGMGFDLTRQS